MGVHELSAVLKNPTETTPALQKLSTVWFDRGISPGAYKD